MRLHWMHYTRKELLPINWEIFSLPGYNCLREGWSKLTPLTKAQICLYWILIGLPFFLYKLIPNVALKWLKIEFGYFLWKKVQTDFSLQFCHSNIQPHPYSPDWGNYQEHLHIVSLALFIDWFTKHCFPDNRRSLKQTAA